MVDIKINTADVKGGFDKACAELEDIMFGKVQIAGEYLKAKTVEEAPSDTGRLRASIFSKASKKKGELKAVVGSNLEYAPYVHQGTGIYAKGGNGRKSSWKVSTIYKGKKVFFVTKGQKPNPFLFRAKEKGLGDIKRLLGVD